MTHTKDLPRSTAPTINRKPHTKSRTGCYNCKARRVKCPETRPECDNCRLRQLDCVYPSQFKSPSHQITRRLQPNYNTKNYAAAVQFAKSLLSPPIKPVAAPPQFPPFFTIDDMRFFHHYMVAAYPYLPYDSDIVWTNEIPILAHQHEFLFHALLSLGASHLTTVTANHSGPEEAHGYAAMLAHRGLALRGLQEAMDRQPKASFTPNTIPENLPELNAMLATCYTLTMQSGHLCDAFTDFIVLIRGCGRLTSHIATLCGVDHHSLPLNLKDSDLRARFPHLVPGNLDNEHCDETHHHDDRIKGSIDMGVVRRAAIALKSLKPLLQHECHRQYHAIILGGMEALQRRDWVDAFVSFQETFTVLCTTEEENFQNHIITPAGEEVSTENNAVFLLLFVYFTAMQIIIYPILTQVMPARARFPQLMMPQLRWLIDISMQVPVALRKYLVVPLEIVAKIGGECGMFRSRIGERVKEGLSGKAEELWQEEPEEEEDGGDDHDHDDDGTDVPTYAEV
ncbi:hypothetical protein ACJ72_05813 [Emergomyces africanus]|uniref:Zn(2)-C6 fungal-type domain-containing protein n=1 Tax=Emergomyces africanus TaxID=1955775 RepID=A0A1B7NSU9_9EURO|nr:hypothetical protein ACJ72_05813 [Emergomyces africanus]